jgi:hypothetical protein
MIMLLQELKLQTSKLPALFNFYKEVLTLPLVQPGKNSISITAGTSQIIFNTADSIENPFYHFAFNIPSNKFEEAFQWIQDKVELLWLNEYESYIADFTNWHAKSFYFTDPAGNILEFIARLDLNDVADERFSGAHIRNVSEIGLVFPVKSFDLDVNKLLKQYSLAYFDKQPPMPHFRAVGNDEGLFVIVPENRIWFSTKNTTSKIFPMEIIFIENDKLFELKM